MSIVGAFDVHRRQLTFEYVDVVTGEVRRGRVVPASRWRTADAACAARAPSSAARRVYPLSRYLARMHDAAGFWSAHGCFHFGHTVSPGDSQGECVTGRLVLAVALTTVLPLDYLMPGAALCGAGTRPPPGGRPGPNPRHRWRWRVPVSRCGPAVAGRGWAVAGRLAGLPGGGSRRAGGRLWRLSSSGKGGRCGSLLGPGGGCWLSPGR
jgi:hypothetical protein